MSTPTLQTYYREKVVPGLQAKHAYKNVHQIPRLEKIVVTSCMGKHPDRKQAVEDAVNEIAKSPDKNPPSPMPARAWPTSRCVKANLWEPA